MATITSPSADDVHTTATTGDGASITVPRLAFGPLALAGLASLGGGAIHAAAIGVHAEHQAAARTFAVLALVQLAWGVVALVGRRRVLALVGLGINAAAVGGWILAKTQGISFIDGMGDVESIQWPDFLAAALASIAVLGALRGLVTGDRGRLPGRFALNAVGIGVVAISLLGMTQAGSHAHAGTGGHGHDDAAAATDGHGHDDAGTDVAAATGDTSADGHAHGPAAAVAPVPYDPTLPIDLSGVAGVTPEQQARAENLIAITLARLPKYADAEVAMADGFFSIGDGFTGHEHFINWGYVTDDYELDPDHPESLVYETGPGGSRTLVSAMFMLAPGLGLDDVPDLGGELTQWHIHDDLCFSDDPVAPHVAGVTSVGGTCEAPLRKLEPAPMIHVWITSHPCGPFAALEGVAAGQVADGETKACDHAHGA